MLAGDKGGCESLRASASSSRLHLINTGSHMTKGKGGAHSIESRSRLRY